MSPLELTPVRELDNASEARAAYAASLPRGSHVHIIGICGTGTAAVLSLLKQLGYRVTGSDKAFYPPMGALVRAEADKVFEGYRAENLAERPDLVVIGNALSRGNPELEAALEQAIPFASMPEVFRGLLIGEHAFCPTSIVVAGTHGKTTTTAAVATLFEEAGRKPGYFIGGVPTTLPSPIRPVSTETPTAERVVVLEGDEYDSAFFAKFSKFHSYRADVAILTSLEFDHADIYNSIEEIGTEFTRFATRIPKTGVMFVCDQSARLVELSRQWQERSVVAAPVVFYGLDERSSIRLLSREPVPVEHSQGGLGQRLVFHLAHGECTVTTPLSGVHNALNLLAAAAVAERSGVSPEHIAAGVARFSGVLRRQQTIFNQQGILVLEDFAHHPTAVATTLAGIKEAFPDRRIVAVFEPRSNTSRRGFFQEEYAKSFDAADRIVLLAVQDSGGYSATGAFKPLDITKLVADIRARGIAAEACPSVDDIREMLAAESKEGDVIVLMSNGDFGGLPSSLPKALGA